MKLRASYGETGNNNIGNYEHIATAIYEKYVLEICSGKIAPRRLANPILTWEKQKQFNAGVNASILKRRINVTVDYFLNQIISLFLT